jgi:type VI secretion system secreted protein Hcp
MAYNFYLDLKGKTQGSIKGHSTKNGKGNSSSKGVVCHGFNYAIQTPHDAASGLPTGKRQHNSIVITKEVDSASPLIYHALATNETFPSAKLSFVRPDSNGKEVVFKTVELTNATISKIGYAVPRQSGHRESTSSRSESITFKFEELAVDGAKNGAIPHSLLG